MMIVKPFLFGVCTLAALTCAGAVAAVSSSLPQEVVQGSASYVSGGVGKDESDAMKQAEKRYPLALEFSQHGASKGDKGDFVADVKLTIEDRNGNTVLNATSTGPFVLAKVPDGKYTVKAEEDGKTQVRQVTVSAGKPERLAIAW
jgi:hypothetical protein